MSDNTQDMLIKKCEGIAETLRTLAPVYFYDKEENTNYFDDVLGGTYYIGLDGSYEGVRLMVACGGPNVYIDTNTYHVEGYWGRYSWLTSIDTETVNAIDDYWCEEYESVREVALL